VAATAAARSASRAARSLMPAHYRIRPLFTTEGTEGHRASVPSLAKAGIRAAMPSAAVRRVAAVDWPRVERELDADGWSRLGPLLSAAQCARLARAFDDDAPFRKLVDMERHGF